MADSALIGTPAGTLRRDGPSRARRRERASATTLGLRTVALFYVTILVLVPVCVLAYRALKPGLGAFFTSLNDPAAQHAFQVTAVVALVSVLIDTVFGVAVAILLVRYRFPGRRLLSALIDLPIAVSPIVVGLALVLVYSPTGWFGPFEQSHGIVIINAKPGMILATVFVSLPLVARAVIPVLEQVGTEQDQAAASLGAHAFTRFIRITLPTIRIALAYGVVLALARCIGEYGAVLVISGNISGQTQTAPLLIGDDFQNFEQDQGYAIAFVLVLIALVAILLGAFIRRRQKRGT
ncbi:MAG TPA: sulfate ABC transporter permease subunit [Jatrophihabitans sp.]|nr:sulfate ABC transporter permease subunit [Jatrophihabitans sp.]